MKIEISGNICQFFSLNPEQEPVEKEAVEFSQELDLRSGGITVFKAKLPLKFSEGTGITAVVLSKSGGVGLQTNQEFAADQWTYYRPATNTHPPSLCSFFLKPKTEISRSRDIPNFYAACTYFASRDSLQNGAGIIIHSFVNKENRTASIRVKIL